MNEGIINKDLLNKDIEQIEYYKNEEKNILNKINNKLNECIDNYTSSNKNLFLTKINNFNDDINKIYEKRGMYITVLKHTIEKYDYLSNKTVDIFSEDNYE